MEAGFDPRGAMDVMKIFTSMEKDDDTPAYLRTHPPAVDREARIKSQIAELEKEKPKIGKLAITAEDADAALAGVAGKLPGVQTAQNPWLPIAVGNRWTYRITNDGAASEYTLAIVAGIAVKENTVYRMETSFGEDMAVQSQVLSTATEVWRRTKPSSPSSPWVMEFALGEDMPEPVLKGGYSYQFLGREDITLPCGQFPATLKIRKTSSDKSSTCDLWFVKDVGMVQRVFKETGVTETLVKYQLAK